MTNAVNTNVNANSFSNRVMVNSVTSSCCAFNIMSILWTGAIIMASVFSLRILVLCLLCVLCLSVLCLLDTRYEIKIGKLRMLLGM